MRIINFLRSIFGFKDVRFDSNFSKNESPKVDDNLEKLKAGVLMLAQAMEKDINEMNKFSSAARNSLHLVSQEDMDDLEQKLEAWEMEASRLDKFRSDLVEWANKSVST